MKVLRLLLRVLGGAALALWFLWTALTLVFSNLASAGLRQGLAGGYVLLLVLVLWRVRPRGRALTAALGCSLMVALAYFSERPSNEREWQPDVAVTPSATVEGERVTVRGVRNFRYRSESDFDQNWEERSYDLAKLRTLDLVMSYWGPVDYCHTLVSFGFEGGEQLAVSVETRKEVGESFSTYAGFFKRFELVYVFADERDVIGVRASHRGEQVYLYRLPTKADRLRELFLNYLDFANQLAREPQYYHVLRNSCGVNILHRVADSGRTVFFGRDALLNGYWDKHLYERGVLDKSLPFEELRERSRIDAVAREAGEAPDFSVRIRRDLPARAPSR